MATDVESQEVPRPRRWRRRWTVWLVLAAALMVLLTLFIAANYVLVEVRLIIWEGQVRLAWALVVAWFAGVILTLAATRLARYC